MTLGWWIALGLVLISGIAFGAFLIYDGAIGGGIGTIFGAVLLSILIACVGFWWCNNTADGARALKDQQSNFNNGLNREITVLAADGREIFHYKGKCDIETDNPTYILFEDEQGYRHIIYKGIQDTIIVSELED